MKAKTLFVAGFLVVVTPSLCYATRSLCGNLYHDSTGQWEHSCWSKPPGDHAHFVRDDSGRPLTPPTPQAAAQPSGGGGTCGKLWVSTRNHWEVRCLTNPPTDGTFIANQGGKNPSPDELRHTPPPSGVHAQTTQSGQYGQAQPPSQQQQPVDYQNAAQGATNLMNSIKGLFRK